MKSLPGVSNSLGPGIPFKFSEQFDNLGVVISKRLTIDFLPTGQTLPTKADFIPATSLKHTWVLSVIIYSMVRVMQVGFAPVGNKSIRSSRELSGTACSVVQCMTGKS